MAEVLTHNQTFASPQAALKHYGVKGMRWGVRKEDGPAGGLGGSSAGPPKKDDLEALKAGTEAFYKSKDPAALQAEGAKKKADQIAHADFSPKQIKREAKAEDIRSRANESDAVAKSLAEERDQITGNSLWNRYERKVYNDQIAIWEKDRDKYLKKADQVEAGKLTDNQKKLIAVGAVAGLAALAVYGNRRYDLHQAGIGAQEKKQLEDDNRRVTADQWSKLFPGQKIPDFQSAATASGASGPGFYAGLTSKKVWDRPEFEIPEGTVFQRLSNHPEDTSEYGKIKGAYSTFLHNDNKLYGAGSEFGGKSYTVNFTAKGPVRVPSHQTVMAHLKMVRKQMNPLDPSVNDDKQMASLYHNMAGGSWSNETSRMLFSSLRQYGYSAIVDDMDAGYLGDLPVVFFGDANPATSTPRTQVDRTRDSVGLLKVSGTHA